MMLTREEILALDAGPELDAETSETGELTWKRLRPA